MPALQDPARKPMVMTMSLSRWSLLGGGWLPNQKTLKLKFLGSYAFTISYAHQEDCNALLKSPTLPLDFWQARLTEFLQQVITYNDMMCGRLLLFCTHLRWGSEVCEVCWWWHPGRWCCLLGFQACGAKCGGVAVAKGSVNYIWLYKYKIDKYHPMWLHDLISQDLQGRL